MRVRARKAQNARTQMWFKKARHASKKNTWWNFFFLPNLARTTQGLYLLSWESVVFRFQQKRVQDERWIGCLAFVCRRQTDYFDTFLIHTTYIIFIKNLTMKIFKKVVYLKLAMANTAKYNGIYESFGNILN